MKKISIILLLCWMALAAKAQVMFGDGEELQALSKKTLLVEVLELDYFKKHVNRVRYNDIDYAPYVEAYNTEIKEAVSKYWKLNTNIEYKTSEELEEIMGKKACTEYVVMYYFEHKHVDAHTVHAVMNMYIPMIGYSDCKMKRGQKPDCMVAVPKIKNRGPFVFEPGEITLAVRMLQNNIQAAIDKGKKLDFTDYAAAAAARNCGHISQKTTVFFKNILDVSPAKLKTEYAGTSEIAQKTEGVSEIITGSQDKLVGVIMPAEIIKVGTVYSYRYAEMIIDPSTAEICGVFGITGLQTGDNVFNAKALNKVSKCGE